MRRRFSQINFSRRSSRVEPFHDPVLTPEDEAFFQSLIAKLDSGDPAPLPDGNLSTIRPVSEDALNTPLPPSPTGEMSEDAVKDEKNPEEKLVSKLSTSEVLARPEKKRRPWNRIRRLSSVMRKVTISISELMKIDAHTFPGREFSQSKLQPQILGCQRETIPCGRQRHVRCSGTAEPIGR